MELQELLEHYRVREHSPVVARIADTYLSQGKYVDVKTLCRSGLDRYPSYTTLTFILAKCCAAEGQYDAAIELLTNVCERHPGVPALQVLMQTWSQQIVTQAPVFSDLHSVQTHDVLEFEDKENEAGSRELSAQDDNTHVRESRGENSQEQMRVPHVDDAVETAPEPLLQAPFPAKEGTESTDKVRETTMSVEVPLYNDEGRIITKTLAEIYVQQGQLVEAITTYELLKQVRPQFAQEAERRIQELRDSLGAGKPPLPS